MSHAHRFSSRTPNRRSSNWMAELLAIIAANVDRGARGRVSGAETQSKHRSILILTFRELRRLGFKLERPQNLKLKHVHAICRHWEEQGIAPATLQNRLSSLRIFCRWIGKPSMVRSSVEYVAKEESVRRTYTARTDKSWKASQVDATRLIQQIAGYDHYVGMQLELMSAFGLRRREAIMMQPIRADRHSYLLVTAGTKGGRSRVVPIETSYQQGVLLRAKAMARTVNGHVGQPDLTLKQALRRFNYVMWRFGITHNQLGVTSHGLRHEYLNDRMQQLGIIPPVRGGPQMPVMREKIDYVRQVISEEAGHARLSITNAYCGSFKQVRRKSSCQR